MLYDLFRFGIKLWSGDTELHETTTKSSVRPILTINGSVLLRIPTSTHRSSRSTHSLEVIEKNLKKLWSGDTGLRETTTKSSVRPILIVNGSVLLRIPTSTHRSSCSTHSLEVIEKSQFAQKTKKEVRLAVVAVDPSNDEHLNSGRRRTIH
ncbi:hypothetical protein HZH66_009910 [Vespula vulgaris]|uniref:Uncharacterized protein n=1 Tax=Vespula vulgaris TaxID=7454 RepID=A0A834MZM0_VESVU|nr:hypothetical protein HZH66_009910 [Vespula vulgaris]